MNGKGRRVCRAVTRGDTHFDPLDRSSLPPLRHRVCTMPASVLVRTPILGPGLISTPRDKANGNSRRSLTASASLVDQHPSR